MGTAWERASSLYDISQKACAYAMPSAVADGMDVFDMRRVVGEAVERARTEKMPTLIEARCYRFMGHSMTDPVHGVYRTKRRSRRRSTGTRSEPISRAARKRGCWPTRA